MDLRRMKPQRRRRTRGNLGSYTSVGACSRQSIRTDDEAGATVGVEQQEQGKSEGKIAGAEENRVDAAAAAGAPAK